MAEQGPTPKGVTRAPSSSCALFLSELLNPFPTIPIYYFSPQIVLYQPLSLLPNVLKLPHLPHSGPKPATFLSPAEEQQLVCLAQPLSVPADTSQPLSRRYSPRHIDRSRFHRASSRAGGFQRGTGCQKAFH